ncbi:hypothetical protein ACFO1B_39130 [Dactylosporangium siamense]|uniref:Uncharacterized protein n=1 Tax=Dactylosporangium siamense TaxID=685454 RepID=A0A919UCF3_9ACTN|nr:hypothetical protein [Dactylosporangium siamense]GIG50307.1 hypothetical protein Dsi01nite_083480 [Dactylosporangium siamense]
MIAPDEPVAGGFPPSDAVLLRVRRLESRVQLLELTVRDLAAALDRLDRDDAVTVVRRALDQLS